ncbi:MAG: hypothetical protein IJH65_03540 [Methanobrevibacter sp.]|nr:hypothetical protein [Methanobrevibacter sp.]
MEENRNKEEVIPAVVKHGWFYCQVCGQIVGDDNYCKNCGQRLKDGPWEKVRDPFEGKLS